MPLSERSPSAVWSECSPVVCVSNLNMCMSCADTTGATGSEMTESPADLLIVAVPRGHGRARTSGYLARMPYIVWDCMACPLLSLERTALPIVELGRSFDLIDGVPVRDLTGSIAVHTQRCCSRISAPTFSK